jgi:hypothetical protein
MSVRSAFTVSLWSAFTVPAVVLGLALLVIVFVLGAILALAYRNSRPGFSYFAHSLSAVIVGDPRAAVPYPPHGPNLDLSSRL